MEVNNEKVTDRIEKKFKKHINLKLMNLLEGIMTLKHLGFVLKYKVFVLY